MTGEIMVHVPAWRWLFAGFIGVTLCTSHGCSCSRDNPPPTPTAQSQEQTEAESAPAENSHDESATSTASAAGSETADASQLTAKPVAKDEADATADDAAASQGAGAAPDAANSDPGSPAAGGARAPRDPAADLKEAERLQRRAMQAAEHGKNGEAFQSALDAWNLVKGHTSHAGCQQLADQIYPTLKTYGEQANRGQQGAGALNDKPLVVE